MARAIWTGDTRCTHIPYAGKLGLIEEGALADLLLVDGDPIANIKLIEDPVKNFVVIVKDGKVVKNTLTR